MTMFCAPVLDYPLLMRFAFSVERVPPMSSILGVRLIR